MQQTRRQENRLHAVFSVLILCLAIHLILPLPRAVLRALQAAGVGLSSYTIDFLLGQFLYPVFLSLLAFAGMRLLLLEKREAFPISRPRTDILPWLGLFLGAVTAGNELIRLASSLFESVGIAIPEPFAADTPKTVGEFLGFFIVMAILPAVGEELLFRGFALHALRPLGTKAALLLSSFAFAMIHANVQQIPFAFLMGLLFGITRIKTGNLLYPILFHFINNAWSCIRTALAVFVSPRAAYVASSVADVLFLLCGAAALAYLLKTRALRREKDPDTPKYTASAVFRCVPFLFFTLFYTLITVLNFIDRV